MSKINRMITIPVLILAIGAPSLALSENTEQYIDDATITTKVKAALLADNQLKSMGISVNTDQGTVALSGTVKTADDESKAIKTANGVKGVKAVKDLMVVSGQQQSDD